MASLIAVSCNQQAPQPVSSIFSDVDALVADALTRITEISPQELKAITDSISTVIIDVRSEKEFQSGFIPGAINIPRGSLEFRIARKDIWDKEQMYVPNKTDLLIVYCKHGNRSTLAAESLQKLGYTNVRSLKGGWEAWHKEYHHLLETRLPAGEEPKVEEDGGC